MSGRGTRTRGTGHAADKRVRPQPAERAAWHGRPSDWPFLGETGRDGPELLGLLSRNTGCPPVACTRIGDRDAGPPLDRPEPPSLPSAHIPCGPALWGAGTLCAAASG